MRKDCRFKSWRMYQRIITQNEKTAQIENWQLTQTITFGLRARFRNELEPQTMPEWKTSWRFWENSIKVSRWHWILPLIQPVKPSLNWCCRPKSLISEVMSAKFTLKYSPSSIPPFPKNNTKISKFKSWALFFTNFNILDWFETKNTQMWLT